MGGPTRAPARRTRGLHYANLAIRSKRVRDVCATQLPRALELEPDLVSILIGANDLVKPNVDVAALAVELEGAVTRLRSIGADVLLVTPFLPRRRAAAMYTKRFAAFATALTGIAARTGAILIDTDLHPSLPDRPNWGEDLVHLSSRGHRFLAYRAGRCSPCRTLTPSEPSTRLCTRTSRSGWGSGGVGTRCHGYGDGCTDARRETDESRSTTTMSISGARAPLATSPSADLWWCRGHSYLGQRLPMP